MSADFALNPIVSRLAGIVPAQHLWTPNATSSEKAIFRPFKENQLSG
jgi:hypothetical protein